MGKKKETLRVYQYRVNIDINLYLQVSAENHQEAQDNINQMSLEELLDKSVMHDHHIMHCLTLDESKKI